MKTIPELLREARTADKIPQDVLASRAGLSTRTVCKAEIGKQIKLGTLSRLFSSFETVDKNQWPKWVASYLYGEAGQYAPEVRIMPVGATNGDGLDERLARWVRTLPEERRAILMRCMENPDLLNIMLGVAKLNDMAYKEALIDRIRKRK